MNIHRKDKAKLKQSITVTESRQQQFLENTKTTLSPAYNLVHPTISINPERRAAVADNWTWNYYLEETETTSTTRSDKCFLGEPKQLPLFNKTTFKVEDQDQQHSHDKSSSSLSHGADFDLELRLGYEFTSDSSSPAKGTRKFLWLPDLYSYSWKYILLFIIGIIFVSVSIYHDGHGRQQYLVW